APRLFDIESGEPIDDVMQRLAGENATWNGLRIQAPWPPPNELLELLAQPSLRTLRTLLLSDGVAEMRGAVPASGRWRRGIGGACAVASSEVLVALSRLDLSGNKVGDAGADALARSTRLDSLGSVNLDGNPLSAESVAWLREQSERMFLV